jgi:hypothetical protein
VTTRKHESLERKLSGPRHYLPSAELLEHVELGAFSHTHRSSRASRFESPLIHQPHSRQSPLSGIGDFGRLRAKLSEGGVLFLSETGTSPPPFLG